MGAPLDFVAPPVKLDADGEGQKLGALKHLEVLLAAHHADEAHCAGRRAGSGGAVGCSAGRSKQAEKLILKRIATATARVWCQHTALTHNHPAQCNSTCWPWASVAVHVQQVQAGSAPLLAAAGSKSTSPISAVASMPTGSYV